MLDRHPPAREVLRGRRLRAGHRHGGLDTGGHVPGVSQSVISCTSAPTALKGASACTRQART
jgi:hypothetical protein